jgi:SAM-dependent methyltransferase
MEHDAKYYDQKWNQIIPKMPVGGQYRFDLRKFGYDIAIDTIPEGSKVFDYACGLGYIDQLLKTKGCEVSGCDFSPVAVDYCKEKTGGDFRTTGDFFGGPYDVILAAYFLEHIKEPQKWVEEALKFAPRVICHLPRNFSHHGEHIDMGWNNWGHFKQVFKDFEFMRLDTKEGTEFDTMKDEDIKYRPRLGQFAHPIVEFREKGANMHINAREENNATQKKEEKKVIKEVKEKKKVAKKGKKSIKLTEEVVEITKEDNAS